MLCPWDPGGCICARPTGGWCRLYIQGSKIKRPSNKTSRDVKGLFLGVRFALHRIMVISWLGCSSRTSCMSRWGVVLEYVMGLGPLVLGLIRDKSRLLRGQVKPCLV